MATLLLNSGRNISSENFFEHPASDYTTQQLICYTYNFRNSFPLKSHSTCFFECSANLVTWHYILYWAFYYWIYVLFSKISKFFTQLFTIECMPYFWKYLNFLLCFSLWKLKFSLFTLNASLFWKQLVLRASLISKPDRFRLT